MGWKYLLVSCSPNGTMGVETFDTYDGVETMRKGLKTQGYSERMTETDFRKLKSKQFVVKRAPGVK